MFHHTRTQWVIEGLLLILLLPGAASAQFKAIRIGDVDGFGFGTAPGFSRATLPTPGLLPANVDGVSVLHNDDFLPDFDLNGAVGSSGSTNNFDLRSPAEVGGLFVTGSGFTDLGTTGSDFTDISLSDTYDVSQNADYVLVGGNPITGLVRGHGGPFPKPPAANQDNQPGFQFFFFVADSDIADGTQLYFNMVFGDYDVGNARIDFAGRSGTFSEFVHPTQGQDGLIQALNTEIDFDEVFAPTTGGYVGILGVDFVTTSEPYTAFDFVELSVSPVPEPSTFLLAVLGLAGLALCRKLLPPRRSRLVSVRNIVTSFALLTVTLGISPTFSPSEAGPLVAWGNNDFGQTDVPAGDDFVAIAAGGFHSLALKSDGSLVGWGRNDSGQTNVPPGNGFEAVSAGFWHSLALKSDGSLVAWGLNDSGQTNVPTGNDYIAVEGGYAHSLALKSDGSLVAWGNNANGQQNVPAGNDFVAIATFGSHDLALRADGSLAGWGRNDYGQADVPGGNDFTAIAAGLFHSVALKSDGSLVAWGSASGDKTNVPAGNDFVAIAAGDVFSLAEKSDGSLVAWGLNAYGLLTNLPAGNDFAAIASGGLHGLALRVPEPSSLMLLAIGGLALLRRRPGRGG